MLEHLVDLNEAHADCALNAICLCYAAEQCAHDAGNDASAGAAKRERTSLQASGQHVWVSTTLNQSMPVRIMHDHIVSPLTIVYVLPLPVCP